MYCATKSHVKVSRWRLDKERASVDVIRLLGLGSLRLDLRSDFAMEAAEERVDELKMDQLPVGVSAGHAKSAARCAARALKTVVHGGTRGHERSTAVECLCPHCTVRHREHNAGRQTRTGHADADADDGVDSE